MEQVYIVGLREFKDSFTDETSVDASSNEEALRVASDLFKEFHPEMDLETIQTNVEILEIKPITEDE